jgi:ribosomal-protein-alanine N-acetyltransferase
MKLFVSENCECPPLETARLRLEPITEDHAQELCELFSDPELHQFVPLEVPTLELQRERCARWAKRWSPDGSERWLNWAGREKTSGKIIAHFQSGVTKDGVASIGYVVSRAHQKQGLATEGLEIMFRFLREIIKVREIKAWSDSRNHASHHLAQKLGMVQVEFIKDADFFKGATSDEFVFSKVFTI